MAGQVEVLVGQVNFRGSLPRSENNVLQPMLHPECPPWQQSMAVTSLENMINKQSVPVPHVKERKYLHLLVEAGEILKARNYNVC